MRQIQIPAWYKACSSTSTAKSKYFLSPGPFAFDGRIIWRNMYSVLNRSAGGNEKFAKTKGFMLRVPLAWA